MSELSDVYRKYLACGLGGIEALEPASEAEISDFIERYQQRCKMAPPAEWIELARIAGCAIWNNTHVGIDLLHTEAQDAGPAFERAIEFIHDGCGNSLMVDVSSDGKLGPVLFNCHDPCGVTVVAPSLKTFFAREIKAAKTSELIFSDGGCGLDYSFESIDLGLSYDEVIAGSSRALKAYAEKIGPNNLFVDFRSCKTGLSFHYHKTRKEPMARDWPALRDGENLIFAIPLIEHKPTIFQRISALFGKK